MHASLVTKPRRLCFADTWKLSCLLFIKFALQTKIGILKYVLFDGFNIT